MDVTLIWRQLSFFISSTHSQNYLDTCYKQIGITEHERRSFENCYPFIYYLEHGKNYYELAKISPLSIQPVLLFYGMVQLLKACLLTVDPNYPESTSVLAHGVTTRKRKKQGYEFLQDEVKVQRNGLCTHIAEKMFHVKHLEGEKFVMEHLLKRIVELNDLFMYSKNTPHLYEIQRKTENMIMVPRPILDRYNMTEKRFSEYFQTSCSSLTVRFEPTQSTKEYMLFHSSAEEWTYPLHNPLLYHVYSDTYYFPSTREQMVIFPEIVTHYLLLYNLSMIARYETEWLSELLHSYGTTDYPFIHQFLSVTADKIPYYIYQFLIQKR